MKRSRLIGPEPTSRDICYLVAIEAKANMPACEKSGCDVCCNAQRTMAL